MRNKMLLVSTVFVLALAWTVTAYAGDSGTSTGWNNFWGAIGGFFYNALPWNWHNWAGKS